MRRSHITGSIPPWVAQIRTNRTDAIELSLSDRWLDRFIIVPEYRLAFCYIEKVAGTSFNELFREVRGQHRSGPTFWRNDPSAHGLQKSDLERIVSTPEWHKAGLPTRVYLRYLGQSYPATYHADRPLSLL